MVEGYTVRMRLQEFNEIGGGLLDDIPVEAKGRKPKLLKIHVIGTPPDVAAFSEIAPPATIVYNSTAVAIETISSSANDNLQAGAHGQKIKTIAINELNDMIVREEDGDPTDWTTFQTTTNLYKATFHSYGSSWGTGDKDFAGNLDCRSIADAVTVRLANGGNESNGARFIVPDGHVAMLYGGQLTRNALTVDEGNKIRLVYIDVLDQTTGLVAADRTINWIEFVVGAAELALHKTLKIPKGFMFEALTWIVLQHSSLVNLGEEYDLTLDFLIWKK